ncbi:MAG TPA: gliding motility lipoprotein GldH [Bacteroidia bacterium]|nr:gliding motility lipoprotein GldH [Bacteroidia bacterium]HNT79047.1 gliding motility lipoprotein GldH [Bacteroidia bacterium]
MKFSFIRFITLLYLFFLVVSCDQQRVFESNKAIGAKGWDMNESIDFLIDVPDTSKSYHLYLNTRNVGDYKFSNLYLFINTYTPSGIVQRDTAEIILAEESGKWLGNGIGDLYAKQTLFVRGFKFKELGEYRFEIMQAMRINPLLGIEDIGMRLEYAQ